MGRPKGKKDGKDRAVNPASLANLRPFQPKYPNEKGKSFHIRGSSRLLGQFGSLTPEERAQVITLGLAKFDQ